MLFSLFKNVAETSFCPQQKQNFKIAEAKNQNLAGKFEFYN
jgi:hypothetical protein